MTALNGLLGYEPTDRLVILVCDGLGSSNAANLGIANAMTNGLATTAMLSIPCPWARGAAAQHRGEDIGVSLTCLAEYDNYRWGPITSAPSLLDGDGGFPRTAEDLGEHADHEELLRECRAQIERAIGWGFDISSIGSHLDALCTRPELFDVLLEMAVEHAVPLSLPDPSVDLGYPARQLAAAEGILTPDFVVRAQHGKESRPALESALRNLRPGVTELHVRPASDTPEIRAITTNWTASVSDEHLVTADWGFRSTFGRSGAKLIGFKELRTAQRK